MSRHTHALAFAALATFAFGASPALASRAIMQAQAPIPATPVANAIPTAVIGTGGRGKH